MTTISRRGFGGLFGASALGLAMPSLAFGATPKVVVIGGGAGGATAARYIAKDSKGAIDVTLVEASKRYYTCFFSNLYIGGFRKYASIGHNYYGLAVNNRINVVHEWAASVDGAARTVTLASGGKLSYDKLVLSPGIALKYDSIAGYSPQAQGRMPHGWTSGTQAQQIRNQVMTMKKGGTFVMVAPPNPYRCPPGPYERVSMIAHLLKERNPTANIYVLGDASVASAMPKSGFSANSQAKVAANAIRGELTGSRVYDARFANTCWSLIATNDGVKVGANYKAGSEKIDVVDKFVSQGNESSEVRKTTYEESIGWYSGLPPICSHRISAGNLKKAGHFDRLFFKDETA
ncbi:MAG: hypothetical protein EBZ11_06125 [Alphaproteobacteria bacterium]|nr:hypothetical protein [Alphaproteobacteria bacterium]